MTMASETSIGVLRARAFGKDYLRTVLDLLLRPGSFFEALPTARNRRDAVLFLWVTAGIYSMMATVFTPEQRSVFLMLYLLNALLLPVVTALLLYALLWFFQPGRFGFERLFMITAHANVVLLLGWIPGFAPWAEMAKYVFIGLGLVKSLGVSGLKAVGAIVATGFLLIMMVFFLQFLMRF